MNTRFLGLLACAPLALFLTACADGERIPVSLGSGDADSSALAIEARSVTPAGAAGLSIDFHGEVHEIEVRRCDGGCEGMDDWGSFDAATVVWQTGVGAFEWSPDAATEPRLDPPTIASGVRYGITPPGAGYAIDVTPLVDGRYSVLVSVYDPCNEGYGQAQCLHTASHGAAYFDVVNGSVIAR